MAERRKVSCGKKSGHCGKYDPNVDGSTLNEFAVAALRLLHVNTPETVSFYDKSNNIAIVHLEILLFNLLRFQLDYKKTMTESLADMTTRGPVVLETHYLDVLRGLLSVPSKFDHYPNVVSI